MAKEKKKKGIKKRIFILFIILFLSGFSYHFISNRNSSNTAVIKEVDNIKEYEYSLNSNATSYYKKIFGELKDVLNSEPVNDEEYAKKVAQLFITDLFTMSNKLTSSDIGGIQFVYTDFQDDYISIVQSGLYKIIKSNIYGDRDQKLPEVTEVVVDSSSKETFKYKDKNFDNSYSINLTIKYKENLGYPSKYKVVLVKNDKSFEVVKASEIK